MYINKNRAYIKNKYKTHLIKHNIYKLQDNINSNNILIPAIKRRKYNDPISTDTFDIIPYDNYLSNRPLKHNIKQERKQCKICKIFIFKNHYQSHIQSHCNELKCNICNNICNSRLALKQHYIYHKQGYKYFCFKCNKKWKQESSSIKHSTFGCTFNCNKCKKSFKDKEQYKLHYKTHSKSYKCSYDNCTNAYHSKSQLSNHIIKIHTQQFPFQCELCKIGFIYKNKLKQHIKECIFTNVDSNILDNILKP